MCTLPEGFWKISLVPFNEPPYQILSYYYTNVVLVWANGKEDPPIRLGNSDKMSASHKCTDLKLPHNSNSNSNSNSNTD